MKTVSLVFFCIFAGFVFCFSMFTWAWCFTKDEKKANEFAISGSVSLIIAGVLCLGYALYLYLRK